ncbi:MAG: glycosyltransferase [Micromonosporaceae bacterium]|jgi:Glycosyltransferase|nr:glycosyltransferase [Micromonosporaceae bacterium]
MKVGICDFPSAYQFPPRGYGGIERWLWSVAVGAQDWGAEVYLIGPQWRSDAPGRFRRREVRLEDADASALADLNRLGLDLLVVGHEYPALPSWRAAWQSLDCPVVTFQHDATFAHPAGTFDGARSRLYCYSPEMCARYAAHQPVQELSVQTGIDEDPRPARHGHHLLWLGRVCAPKAPHLAVLAAQRLGRRLRIVGPIHDEQYVRRHADILHADHVEWVGEVGGADKAAVLRAGQTLVYTCSRAYVEAGAAVFGEALRAGTPVAALAWRPGTCAQAALCEQTGVVAAVNAEDDDETAADALALAIEAADRLDPHTVQAVGFERFHPVRHFEVLAGLR